MPRVRLKQRPRRYRPRFRFWAWSAGILGVGALAFTLPQLVQVHPISIAPRAREDVRLPKDPEKWSTQAGSCEMKAAQGPVLFVKGQNIERPIASTTKIMTAYLTLTNPAMPLNKRVTINRQETVNDRLGLLKDDSEVPLRTGMVVTVHDLLWALMLPSADDAAWTLARAQTDNHPTQFVAAMNREAKLLQMNRTHYTDPDGVSHEGYSTARDLIKLTTVAMKNATFRQLVKTKTQRTPFGELTNLNQMLWQYPGTIGVKTGWTPWAGSCLVFAATKRLHGQPLTIYGVVLGEPSFNPMFADTAQLMNTAFHVPWTPLFPAKVPVATALVTTSFGKRIESFSLTQALGAYDTGEQAHLQFRWKNLGDHWSKGQTVGYGRVVAQGWAPSAWVPIQADQSYRMPWWSHL